MKKKKQQKLSSQTKVVQDEKIILNRALSAYQVYSSIQEYVHREDCHLHWKFFCKKIIRLLTEQQIFQKVKTKGVCQYHGANIVTNSCEKERKHSEEIK